jgi:hypothetical protein
MIDAKKLVAPVKALIKWITWRLRWLLAPGERIGQSSYSTDVESGKGERHPALFLELA